MVDYTKEESAILQENSKAIRKIAQDAGGSPRLNAVAAQIISILKTDKSLLKFNKDRDEYPLRDLLAQCESLADQDVKKEAEKFRLALERQGFAPVSPEAEASTTSPSAAVRYKPVTQRALEAAARGALSAAQRVGGAYSAARGAVTVAVGDKIVEYVRTNYKDKGSKFPAPKPGAEKEADDALILAGIQLIRSCGEATQYAGGGLAATAIPSLISLQGAAIFMASTATALTATAFVDMATKMQTLMESTAPADQETKDLFFKSEFGDRLRTLGLISSTMPTNKNVAATALALYAKSLSPSASSGIVLSGGLYASIVGYDVKRIIKTTLAEERKPDFKERYRPGTSEFGFVPIVPNLIASITIGFGIVAITLVCIPPLGLAAGFAGVATTVAAIGVPAFLGAGVSLATAIFATKAYLPKLVSRSVINMKKAFANFKARFSRRPTVELTRTTTQAPAVRRPGSGVSVPGATARQSDGSFIKRDQERRRSGPSRSQ